MIFLPPGEKIRFFSPKRFCLFSCVSPKPSFSFFFPISFLFPLFLFFLYHSFPFLLLFLSHFPSLFPSSPCLPFLSPSPSIPYPFFHLPFPFPSSLFASPSLLPSSLLLPFFP